MRITSPHDRFTRAALSEQRVAQAFFETHLPKKILKQINLHTLELTQESFVDEKLKRVISDMLFKVDWGHQAGYLYLLVEAQSHAERFMPLRILKYQLEALALHLKMTEATTLPVIYGIVLYNGKHPYNQPTSIFELFGDNEALAREIFLQPFQLIDLTQIADEEIRQSQWLAILEGCLKHSRDQDIVQFFRKISTVLQQAEQAGAQRLVEAALTYLLATGNVRDPHILETIIQQELSKETRESMMGTMAEYYMEKARKEGLQKGIQEGMEEGRQQGMQQGIELGKQKGMQRGIEEGMQQGIELGMQQGMQQGMQRGIELGKQKGMQQGEYKLLLRQLEQKFKKIPLAYRQRLMAADAETLLTMGERFVNVTKLEDIFG